MKNKHFTKIIALFMCMLVLVSAFSLPVFAADGASGEENPTDVFFRVLISVIIEIVALLLTAVLCVIAAIFVFVLAILLIPVFLIGLLFGFAQNVLGWFIQFIILIQSCLTAFNFWIFAILGSLL